MAILIFPVVFVVTPLNEHWLVGERSHTNIKKK